MNHWLFIVAAYGLTLTALAGILAASWRAMRKAEAAAATLSAPR